MTPCFEDYKDELEHLFLRDRLKKTYQQIKDHMEKTHGFTRSIKSYERQFKNWGFRKNVKSSVSKAIYCGIEKRRGKKSKVLHNGTVLDLEDPKMKRKIQRNAPLPGTTFTFTKEKIVKELYIYSPPPDRSSQLYKDLLKGLPWYGFQHLLPPNERNYPDLTVMARQIAIEFAITPSGSDSVIPVRSTSNAVSLSTMFGKIMLHSHSHHFALDQNSRENRTFLESLLIPDVQDDSPTCNGLNSGTVQFGGCRYTPYFSLLVFLASNNVLDICNHASILDYAEDLILRRQFEVVLSNPQPTIRALLDTVLAIAVRGNNVSVVRAALSAGAFPGVFVDRNPALVLASARGDIEMIKDLLRCGAEPLSYTELMHAPLVVAATRGKINVVKLLLEKGGGNKSLAAEALYQAITMRHWEICDLILSADTGLDVNSRSFLQNAVQVGCMKLVVSLIKLGADVNAVAKLWGKTALQAAISRGEIGIAKYLLQVGANVNQKAPVGGKTALQCASQINNKELCILLLQAGADVNAPAALEGGQTALQTAAQYADIDVIDLLLKAGADVHASNNTGMTVLGAAVQGKRYKVVGFLLNHGVGVDGIALKEAVILDDLVLVELFLDHGADPNACDALHAATRNGNIAMVRQLLKAGAEIRRESRNPSSGRNESILALAIASGGSRLERAILGWGDEVFDEEDDLDDYDSRAVAVSFEKVKNEWNLREFPFVHSMMSEISARTDVISVCSGSELQNAIHRIHNTNINLVEYLLDHGIAVDSRENNDSPTALHLAVMYHDFPVIERLLEAGANINLLWYGRSVIQTAITALKKPWEWDGRGTCEARVLIHAWDVFNKSGCTDEISHRSDSHEDLAVSDLLYHFLRMLRLGATKDNSKKAAVARQIAEDQRQQHRTEIVQKLLDLGVDPNIRAEGYPTALQAAALSANTSLVRILLNTNADVNAPPRQVILRNGCYNDRAYTALQASIMADKGSFDINIVHLLLDQGADINAPAPQGSRTRTALQAAIATGNSMDLVQLLLGRGADINAPPGPDASLTALQAAAINGYVGLATQLLEAGANVNAPGSSVNGRTALEGAAEMGRLDMVKLLLNAGAGVGIDEFGVLMYETAVEFAIKCGHRVVHDLIKSHFEDGLNWQISGAEEDTANTE